VPDKASQPEGQENSTPKESSVQLDIQDNSATASHTSEQVSHSNICDPRLQQKGQSFFDTEQEASKPANRNRNPTLQTNPMQAKKNMYDVGHHETELTLSAQLRDKTCPTGANKHDNTANLNVLDQSFEFDGRLSCL
jgi:hypothetical protein